MCSVNVKHSLKIFETRKALVMKTSQLDRFCFMAANKRIIAKLHNNVSSFIL